jgi:hypothetical protein
MGTVSEKVAQFARRCCWLVVGDKQVARAPVLHIKTSQANKESHSEQKISQHLYIRGELSTAGRRGCNQPTSEMCPFFFGG